MEAIEELKGKKLLILGASRAEVSLVKRAQQMGVYTIVTDLYTDHRVSPAKDVADEAWDISWSDLDMLERICRETGVDGVTAGYSEFRVENLIGLCERLDLPCYCTEEQLEITRDKKKFKDTCRACGVPVVREYPNPESVTSFPVIVKPVDRGGSIGISIANDPGQLAEAYRYAMEMSVCKQVIIEDYIHEGEKVDIYYAVEAGVPQVLTTCDTIPAKENGFERVVQSSWLYPERYRAQMLEQCGESMERMIRTMGIRYGCIFFSGFVSPQKTFQFFECGFRLEGGHQYGYSERRGMFHFLDLFILHALTGSTGLMHRGTENPDMKCVTINLYAKKGTVGAIRGAEEIAAMPDCSLMLVNAYSGMECSDAHAILKKLGMFSFCAESPEQLQKDVEQAYALLSVVDTDGQDMIYDRIDPAEIGTWWEKK